MEKNKWKHEERKANADKECKQDEDLVRII